MEIPSHVRQNSKSHTLLVWVRTLIIGIVDDALQLSQTVAERLDILTKLGIFDICLKQIGEKSEREA